MRIGVDKAQKSGKHDMKHKMLEGKGHILVDMPIPVGDYIEITPAIEDVMKRRGSKLKKMDTIGLIGVSVDTKRDMNELYQCLTQGHDRFSDSCLLASNNNIKLFILTENTDGIESVDDIGKWKNEARWKSYFSRKRAAERAGKRIPKKPRTPTELKKSMWTMNQKYGVTFLFCKPEETADVIETLLKRG